jgi:hypothetical protein
MRALFLREQVLAAVADGLVPDIEAMRWLAKYDVSLIEGGAQAYYVTNAEAISMLTDYGVGIDAGTAAVIQIYTNNVGTPADADAANTNTLLATLTCSATAFTSVADNAPGALATFATITQDSSADATATAVFFRISTQSGGTVVGQGTVGTATSDLILNTTAITSGSAVAITAATLELEEGP